MTGFAWFIVGMSVAIALLSFAALCARVRSDINFAVNKKELENARKQLSADIEDYRNKVNRAIIASNRSELRKYGIEEIPASRPGDIGQPVSLGSLTETSAGTVRRISNADSER